ncbi:MAG: hypothetical protein U9P38_07595, partial [Campylobacterota bacterium]|nr:hypothetical protein [Campylobacterota bacterium]
ELLTQGDIYKRFRWGIGRQDFKVVFELAKIHPFLTNLQEYITLIEYADGLYINALKLIETGDNISAIKMLRVLLDFPDFKDEVKLLLKNIEIKQQFLEAVKYDNLLIAYNLMERSSELQNTKEGLKLQEKSKKDFSKANRYAMQGDVENIEKIVKPYFKISSKYRLLAALFRLCYLVQIEQALRFQKTKREIEIGIKNYILFFGIDNKIKIFFNAFLRDYKDSKLNIDFLQKGSFEKWKPIMVVKSILE